MYYIKPLNTMKQIIIIGAVWLILSNSLQSCLNSQAQNNKQQLLTRKDTSGTAQEWGQITQKHNELCDAIKQNPNDNNSKIKLAALYLNEGRNTGNTTHYNAIAMQIINGILADVGSNPEQQYFALSFKASILLSLHQFADAKKIAMLAQKLNPYDADIYGALVDASVELGEYDSAVAYCDKMISIRPDLRSYSRISYVREIYGDNNGAMQAMQFAVDAGVPGAENTEWARVQLAQLYLNKNSTDTAQLLLQQALALRPNYVLAIFGLAKVAEQKADYPTAIAHCEKAIATLSESSYVSYLAKINALNNNRAKASAINKDVVQLLEAVEKQNTSEKLIPHNGNRELAQAYLNNNQLDKALLHAQKDLASRPNNIDANELVAEIYFAQKNYVAASKHAHLAMHTGKKNKETLAKIKAIYQANNETKELSQITTVLSNL
jgi:tetratricopeptide (TPR) repeat protein